MKQLELKQFQLLNSPAIESDFIALKKPRNKTCRDKQRKAFADGCIINSRETNLQKKR